MGQVAGSSSSRWHGVLHTEDGAKVTLSELLNKVPRNNWKWRMFQFEGVGVAPKGLAMPDFEDLVLSEKYGYAFTWNELVLFAERLSDVRSCLLAAVSQPVEYVALNDGAEAGVIAFIGVYDSTQWEIRLP